MCQLCSLDEEAKYLLKKFDVIWKKKNLPVLCNI